MSDNKRKVDTKATLLSAKKHKANDDDDIMAAVLENDDLLGLIVEFAVDSVVTLETLRHTNKRFLSIVDTNLFRIESSGEDDTTQGTKKKGIIVNILKANGHDGLAGTFWRDLTSSPPLLLESLWYYHAVHTAGLFEKKKVASNNPDIPKSVSRVLELLALLEDFPLVKASWEEGGLCGDPLNVVAAIVTRMLVTGVLPDPDHINIQEHINIVTSGRKKYQHALYREYNASVPCNLFTPSQLRLYWPDVPLQLKLLVAVGNKGKRY